MGASSLASRPPSRSTPPALPRPTVESSLQLRTKARVVDVGRTFSVAVAERAAKDEEIRGLLGAGTVRLAELIRTRRRDEAAGRVPPPLAIGRLASVENVATHFGVASPSTTGFESSTCPATRPAPVEVRVVRGGRGGAGPGSDRRRLRRHGRRSVNTNQPRSLAQAYVRRYGRHVPGRGLHELQGPAQPREGRPAARREGRDRWYVPDPNKQAEREALREKALLREFEEYRTSTQRKLNVFRTEAVRAGFKACWQERDYGTIVKVAEKLPDAVLQEDEKLLMYYDNALTRLGGE